MPTKAVSRIARQLHPDTLSYQRRVRTAGGLVPPAKASAINSFISFAYNTGLRNRARQSHKQQYFLCLAGSASFAGCNVPIWDDGVGNAVLNNYVSGDWNNSGLAGNGSSKYLDTNWNPSGKGLTTTGSLLQWCTSVTLLSGYAVLGSAPSSSERMIIYYASVPDYGGQLFNESAGFSNSAFPVTPGLQLINQPGSNIRLLFNNAVINTGLSGGTPPDTNLFFGAANYPGGASFYYSDRILFSGMGLGLSTVDETALYNGLSTLKARLGA